MREASRLAGIAAYTFFIKLYALDALLDLAESGCVRADGTIASVTRYFTQGIDTRLRWLLVMSYYFVSWSTCCSSRYEAVTLAEEFDRNHLIRDCLTDLVSMKAEVANMAADGKTRDDVRGERIIPDYFDVHKPAASEPVVLQAQWFDHCILCLFVVSCIRLTFEMCFVFI